MSDDLANRQSAEGGFPPIGITRHSFPGSLAPLPDAEVARQMLNTVAAGIIKISPEGRILYANTQARRLMTIHEIDPLGMSIREFEPYTVWPDGSPCAYDDYPPIKCLRTGELQAGIVVGLQLPGAPMLWIKVTAEPLLDPTTGKPEAALVTLVESTHPQHVEESLRQSEDRYRRLIENSPDAIVVHRGGPIVFINEAGVKLWRGRSREAFIGRNVLDFVHPDDRETATRRMLNAMAGAATPLVVQRHLRLDGRLRYVEVTGTSCVYDGQPSVQVLFRDVTRRRRIDRLVRRQREILRVFFNQIPVLVGIFGVDGLAKATNREWKRVIGYDRELTIDRLLDKFYPDQAERQQALEYLQAAPAGWRDFRCRVHDGGLRDLSWANIVLSSGDRIVMALDVTEQRQAAEDLRRTKEELERRVTERTEELTRKNAELRGKQRFMERTLAAQERDRKLVAYEIHDTILQEVIGALMFVDTMYENAATSKALAAEAIDIAPLKQARKLLRKCIDGARQMISGLRPPIIDEQGVAGAVDYLVSEFNARGMAIRYSHELTADRLFPDLETTIFRIVQEALTNVERHSGVTQGSVGIRQHEETIRIEVRDQGQGFDLEGVGEGHFGLEGIRERARLMGGSAVIQSSPGRGTEVVVELPVRLLRNEQI
jgi:PAS domain S-box-containing protein